MSKGEKSEEHRTSDLFAQPFPVLASPEPHLVAPKLSLVKKRLIEAALLIRQDAAEDILYHHSVMCQTALPVRRPKDGARVWERHQGRTALSIEAGRAHDPAKGQFVELPLPFGPKARLVLMHLNSEAIRTRSPEIEVEDSMTAFVRRLMRTDPNGREIRAFKDQLSALSVAKIYLAAATDTQGAQINEQIIRRLNVWFPKDERQRVLWPSTIQLSTDYFESLLGHAVPLDERAIASLAHSAIALDVYAWLAQRLHRIPARKPQFVPWKGMHEQFGHGYQAVRFFRRDFLTTLRQVQAAYPQARLDLSDKGMTLHHSQPPIAKRMHVIAAPTIDHETA